MNRSSRSTARCIAQLGLGYYFLVAVTSNAAPAESAWDPATLKVAIAIRYLQVEGVSHAHVYLFTGDGRFIRQLTDDASGQDFEPVFDPTGQEIVFARKNGKTQGYWSVGVSDQTPHHLENAPQWYLDALAEPMDRFDYPPDAPLPHHPDQRRLADYIRPGEVNYRALDNSVEIVLRDDPSGAEPADDWYPKTPYLRDPQDRSETKISSLPMVTLAQNATPEERRMRSHAGGELGLCPRDGDEPFKLDSVLIRNGSSFYFQNSARLAFLREHHNSTCGESWYVLNLDDRRLAEVFPNDGSIILIPEAPGFLGLCQERYLDLGDGKRTVNCSYLDLWTPNLRRIRFARARPARCYGASIYDPVAQRRIAVVRPWGLTE